MADQNPEFGQGEIASPPGAGGLSPIKDTPKNSNKEQDPAGKKVLAERETTWITKLGRRFGLVNPVPVEEEDEDEENPEDDEGEQGGDDGSEGEENGDEGNEGEDNDSNEDDGKKQDENEEGEEKPKDEKEGKTEEEQGQNQQQQQAKEQKEQAQQALKKQAGEALKKEEKETLKAAAKRIASQAAKKAATWFMEVAIPAIIAFILEFGWIILIVIIAIALFAVIFAYVRSGRSGSIPGQAIEMTNPAHAAAVNKLLALNGQPDAIAKELQNSSGDLSKTINTLIDAYQKISTPTGQKILSELRYMQSQVRQLPLAGKNPGQLKTVVSNIADSLAKIQKLIGGDSRESANKILSDQYKGKIIAKGWPLKDIQDAAAGKAVGRGQGGNSSHDVGAHYINPGVFDALIYLADKGFQVSPGMFVRSALDHNNSIPDHWYGAAVDISSDDNQQKKMIEALLSSNDPAIRPIHIYGNISNDVINKEFPNNGIYSFQTGHGDKGINYHIHVSYW